MNYRYLAAATGMMMLLVPFAAFAQDLPDPPKGGPEHTFSTIGGLDAQVAVNVVPQELDALGNPRAVTGEPAGQKLKSASVYDCETGKEIGSGGKAYTMDAVAMSYVPGVGVTGFNDQDVADPLNSSTPTTQNYTYNSDFYLGFGATKPAALPAADVMFLVFLKCDGRDTSVLPENKTGQTKGIFAFHDENEWTSGTANPWQPEFRFAFQGVSAYGEGAGANPMAGQVLPGQVVTTTGWYMTSFLSCCVETVHTLTFRYVLNPSLTSAYPGYTGSGVANQNGHCFVNAEGGEKGSALGQCRADGVLVDGPVAVKVPHHFFFTTPAPATAAAPAPVLEDVDIYYTPDKSLLNQEIITPLYMEAEGDFFVASQPVYGAYHTALNAALPAREAEPNSAADKSALDPSTLVARSKISSTEWSYYLDVFKWSNNVNFDPLYGAGVTPHRDIYPGGTSFSAYLGLAKDTNKDGWIDTANFYATEWWAITDSLQVKQGNVTKTISWGDIGVDAAGGNDFLLVEDAIATDTCFGETSANYGPFNYAAGTPIPIGSVNGACARPNSNNVTFGGTFNAGSWGLFQGTTSTSLTGRYEADMVIYAPTGSSFGEALSKVKARVVWPAKDVFMSNVQAKFLPADFPEPVWGSTVILQDIDVYGPTVAG